MGKIFDKNTILGEWLFCIPLHLFVLYLSSGANKEMITKKNSTGPDGGPCSRVCARLNLHSRVRPIPVNIGYTDTDTGIGIGISIGIGKM
jgi:hypothetical protein